MEESSRRQKPPWHPSECRGGCAFVALICRGRPMCLPLQVVYLLRYYSGDAPPGQPGRVTTIAACYYHHDIISRTDYGNHSIGVVLVNPARPVAVAIVGNALEPAHRHPSVL